jgi:hypothetical protein
MPRKSGVLCGAHYTRMGAVGQDIAGPMQNGRCWTVPRGTNVRPIFELARSIQLGGIGPLGAGAVTSGFQPYRRHERHFVLGAPGDRAARELAVNAGIAPLELSTKDALPIALEYRLHEMVR